jgi:hypothetical protein
MPRRSSIRASDADRETVTERLRRAAGEGRLLAEELEERLARALRAQTYGELDALVADLPREVSRSASKPRQLAKAHPIATAAIVLAVLAVALIAAVVMALLALAWGGWILIVALFASRRRAPRRGGHAAYRYEAWMGPRGRHRYRYGSWS